jgi:hypothetical protein
MRFRKLMASAAALFLAQSGSALAQDDTHATAAVKEAFQASGHASASAAHAIAATGQVTSGVVAVPFSAGGAALGSAGAASTAAARDSMNAATAPIGTPLPVTDEAIVVVPPDVALKKKETEVKH